MGLDTAEIILILVLALGMFGSEKVRELARNLGQAVIGKRKLSVETWRALLFTVVVTASGFTLIFLERKGRITDNQLLVALGVLSVWALTWWFCFGDRKGDDL